MNRSELVQRNVIYNEDCLIGMDRMPDGSVDMILTSPPYYNAREYSQFESYQNYLSFLESVFEKAYQKLKVGRMIAVNISVVIEPREKRSEESSRKPIPFHLVGIMEGLGYKFLEDIIWLKPEGSAPNRNGGFYQSRMPVQYKPNIVNEYILVFQKPDKGASIDKVLAGYSDATKRSSEVEGDYERSNVWAMNPETKSRHSAPFPIELSNKLIRKYSFKGDLILDMFMGSGTTAISSLLQDREYIGFEMDKQYYKLAQDRIKNHAIQDTLF